MNDKQVITFALKAMIVTLIVIALIIIFTNIDKFNF